MDKRYLFVTVGAMCGALMGAGWLFGCDDPDCHRTQTCAGGNGSVGMACTEGTGMDAGAACSVHCASSCQTCNAACTDGGAIPSCRECLEGFETFWPASAEVMADCLWDVAMATPCNLQQIGACAQMVSASACDPGGAADKTCGEAAMFCVVGVLDIASCRADIVPFHSLALDAYKSCMMNLAPGYDCPSAHAVCYNQVRDMSLAPP